MIVREISAQETYPIRKKVLRINLPLSERMEGDFDEFTFHLGIFLDEVLCGVASFMKNSNSNLEGAQYQLRGMAISSDLQKKGMGKTLLQEGIRILKRKSVGTLWCNARVVAVKFYKNCEFKTLGEEFEIPLVGGHYLMYKILN